MYGFQLHILYLQQYYKMDELRQLFNITNHCTVDSMCHDGLGLGYIPVYKHVYLFKVSE